MEEENSSVWPAKEVFLQTDYSAFHTQGIGGEGMWLAQEGKSVYLFAGGRSIRKCVCLYATCS